MSNNLKESFIREGLIFLVVLTICYIDWHFGTYIAKIYEQGQINWKLFIFLNCIFGFTFSICIVGYPLYLVHKFREQLRKPVNINFPQKQRRVN